MRAQSCLSSRATGLSRGILGSWMDIFFKPLQLPWVKQEMPKHSPRHFPGEAMATKKPPDVYNTLMNAANGPRSNEIAVGFLWILITGWLFRISSWIMTRYDSRDYTSSIKCYLGLFISKHHIHIHSPTMTCSLFPLSRCVLGYSWHRWICGGVFVRSGTPHTRLSGTEMGPDISTISPPVEILFHTAKITAWEILATACYCYLIGVMVPYPPPLPFIHLPKHVISYVSPYRVQGLLVMCATAMGAPGPSRPTRLWKPHWTTMHGLMTCCKINTFAMNHCGRKSRYPPTPLLGGGAREAWSIDCLACLPSHQRDRLRAMYPFPSLFSAGSKVGCLFDAYGHVHPSAMFPPAGVLLYCLWRFEQPRRIDEPSLQRHMLALLRTMYPTNVCLSFVPHPSTFVFSDFENG